MGPDMAALQPTKKLVEILGNGRSIDEWSERIAEHHSNLKLSHVSMVRDSVLTILAELPTTIEEDMLMIPREKKMLEKVRRVGRNDIYKGDTIATLQYRLAFKRALKLAADTADSPGRFFNDSEEL